MRDPRLDQLAAVLVNYSTAVKKGDLVRIGGNAVSIPLMEALHVKVLQAGGFPYFDIATDTLTEDRFRFSSDEQLSFVNPLTMFAVEKMDVYFGIGGDGNTRALTNVPPAKQALASQARKPFLHRLLERAAKGELRWTATQFPSAAAAQDAEMSQHEYADFVFRAGLLHLPDPVAAWRALSEKQQRLVDLLNKAREIRVIGEGTDLRVAVEGRTWINCDGHENFPDGEVFTGPIENATEGTIRYSFPAVYHGRECQDITLTFKAGKVVDARASKGEEFLHHMIDQDSGGRILGEFAIGTNFGITRYTKNTLFDEKIGGTCHAALGAAYPETGGKNQSGLHWDMVCDLRAPGRKILIDNHPLLENGRFLNPDFPNPS
ncbi:MAG TPA: aminopeptidase [Phycisphaerae bacterium]|nr:aminopeptidase [Phycisphaerae bacterium]